MKALITGGSSGIGRDIAIELSKKGYDLILVARDEQKLKDVKNKIKEKSNVNVQIEPMDLNKEENCKILHDKYSDIDILVNNAGFGVHGEFIKTDLEKEVNMIKTNIIAMHVLMKLYLQDMTARNYGIILNTASIAAFMPGPVMASYYGTKAYVLRLSQAVKEELEKSNSKVQISVLCPGPVDTNFNNVSEGKFDIHSVGSEFVARCAVNKMFRGKFIIVPGPLMKIMRFLSKITPHNIVAKIVYHIH